MHYTSGFGLLLSVAGAFSVTGDRPLARVARILLDVAGLGFGVYLLAFVLLTLIARQVQRRARGVPPAARAPRHFSASPPTLHDDAVTP
jgi:hypothetical protein